MRNPVRRRGLSHIFLRVFLSVVGISLLVFCIVAAVIAYSAWSMGQNWPAFVVQSYMEDVLAHLQEVESPSPDDFINVFLSTADERISALVMKSAEGERLFIYDKALLGEAGEASIGPREGVDVSTFSSSDEDRRDFSKRVMTYGIEIQSQDDGSYSYTVSSGNFDDGTSYVSYVYPEAVKREDIAGSVFVAIDGQAAFSFDILVFPMADYQPTRFIVDALVVMIAWIIPLALVVSIVAAWRFSRRTSSSILEMQKALSQIASNDFDIEINPQTTYEFAKISESIYELRDSLERNQRERKEWIRSLAHDLNTPLTSMGIIVDGMADGVFPADGKNLSRLKGELDVLTGRIASVRYYSSLMSPELKLERHQMKALDALSSAINSFPRRDLIDIDVPEDEMLDVDPTYFNRALKEVLDNALEAIGTNDGRICIKVRGGVVEISNPGHLPYPLPDFFEPWVRGDQSRHSGGAGLGLPITGQILRLHGGKASISQVSPDTVLVRLDLSSKSD